MKKIVFFIIFVFIKMTVWSQTQTVPNNLKVENKVIADSSVVSVSILDTVKTVVMDADSINVIVLSVTEIKADSLELPDTVTVVAFRPKEGFSTIDLGDSIIIGDTTFGKNIIDNQTVTLSGDVTGSGAMSITTIVTDDSHNHIISNMDGLQDTIDVHTDSLQLHNDRINTNVLDIELNTTHRISDGSDHTYIDQDVTISGEPTFANLVVNANVSIHDSLIITDNSKNDTVLFFDDGDTTRIKSDNPIKMGRHFLVVDTGILTGKLVLSDSSVVAITTGDTLTTKAYVRLHYGQFSRVDTINTSTVNTWRVIQMDTTSGTNTSGFELNSDSTGVIVKFDGFISFAGYVAVKFNGTPEDDVTVFTRLKVNSTELSCFNKAVTRNFKLNTVTDLVSIAGYLYVSENDTISVEVRVTNINIDLECINGGVFDKTIPFSIFLRQLPEAKLD